MKTLEVFKPGSEVNLYTVDRFDGIPARVLKVQLGVEGVLYQVAWMDGRTRNEQWVLPEEVRKINFNRTSQQRIGFA